MLAAALVWTALVAVQDPYALAEEHLACVRSERTLLLHEALAGLDPERRAALSTQVAARRPAGSGAAAGLGLRDMARATREAEAQPWTALQSLADSLDLSLQPGAFEARSEGPGEALTVRVHALWDADEAPDFELTLTWISPAGERIHARREPVASEFVPGAGFEMYLRPPLSEPGTWLLEPCVERGDERACGLALPVACIADLDGRLAAVRAFLPEGSSPSQALLGTLERLVQIGARRSVALDPAEMLSVLEGSAPASLARPTSLAYVDDAGAEHWIWSLRPAGEIERAICILAHDRETVDAPLAGALGARWSALAEEHGALLYALRLPLGTAGGGARVLLERLAAQARAEVGEPLPLILVARAETSGRLQLMFGQDYPFDGIVISAVVRNPTAERVFPGVPRLLLSPGAVADEDAGLFVGPGAELTIFNDLQLPALTGAWLSRE